MLTATFLHVNLIHILMNMAVLIQLGVLSERFVGGGLIAAVYVVAGTMGNALSSAWAAGHGTELLSAGASGSIMGLLGMVAVLAWLSGQRPLAKALLRNAAFIIVLGVTMAVSGRGMLDNGAHIGGLLAGAAIGWALARSHRRIPPLLDRLLAVAALAVSVGAFAAVLAAHGTR